MAAVSGNLPAYHYLRPGDLCSFIDEDTGNTVIYAVEKDFNFVPVSYVSNNSYGIDQCPGQLMFFESDPSILIDCTDLLHFMP